MLIDVLVRETQDSNTAQRLRSRSQPPKNYIYACRLLNVEAVSFAVRFGVFPFTSPDPLGSLALGSSGNTDNLVFFPSSLNININIHVLLQVPELRGCRRLQP